MMSTPMAKTRTEALATLLLSDDDKQRRCLKVLLLTACVYAVSVMLMAYGTHNGMFRRLPVALLATACIATTVVFYAAIRSGWNQRRADPTLAVPQTVVAQALVAFGYANAGVAHGASLIILVLVMVFGMFNMQVRAVRYVALYAVTLMGAVMAWKAHSDPYLYPAELEWIHFVLVAIVLPAVSQLSVQLMGMRLRLKSGKEELEQALAHIREMATRDELTGLANRRHLASLMQEHAQRLTRGGPEFYIALIDLDHFKAVNDSYGHAVGDEVLRAFAIQARSILRTTDIIGRWGGEEFLLLLPETPPGEPAVGVNRLRFHLENFVAYLPLPELRIGFSAGFTRYRMGEAIDQAIERADRALYMAKAAGRHQTALL